MSSQGSRRLNKVKIIWSHPDKSYLRAHLPSHFPHGYDVISSCVDTFDAFRAEPALIKWAMMDCGIQYRDEDDDWVPIDTQTEYEEALKQLASSVCPLKLRVVAKGDGGHKSKGHGNVITFKCRSRDVDRALRKHQKETSKMVQQQAGGPQAEVSSTFSRGEGPWRPYRPAREQKEHDGNEPPKWFINYMTGLDARMEQRHNIYMREMKAMGDKIKKINLTHASIKEALVAANSGKREVIADSVAGNVGSEDNSPEKCSVNEIPVRPKLLKKLQKAPNSEKKLKKLNTRLEQLQLKRSRLLEWQRKRQEFEVAWQQSGVHSTGSDVQLPAMDAMGLDNTTEKMSVLHGAVFTKTWKILNTGSQAWDDKTELRLVWVTQGLKPAQSTVTCPPLQPGEEGTISMEFQAPDYIGLFESYWHFYHNEERFGHWLKCAVVVAPIAMETGDVYSFSMKKAQVEENAAGPSTSLATKECGEGEEDRGEYESDPDDNNVSPSDMNTASESDSDDSDNSDSFVHVPMPQCYQYQAVPLFDPQVGEVEGLDDREDSLLLGDQPQPKVIKNAKPAATPPTTPREPDSEDELFEEASEVDSHLSSSAPLQGQPGPSNATQDKSPQPVEEAGTPTFASSSPSFPSATSAHVHILPDNLLSGAINVASRALSATEAIVKSLQGGSFLLPANPQPEQEPEVATPPVMTPTTTQPVSTQSTSLYPTIPLPPPQGTTNLEDTLLRDITTPEMRTNMLLLREMGFCDDRINETVLRNNDNNLTNAMPEVLSRYCKD